MKYIISLLLCLFTLTGFGEPKNADRNGEVKGCVIVRSVATPVSGAVIKVVNDTLQTISDSVGNYRIIGLKPGYNTLYVEAEGYRAMVTNSFLVTASTPAVVNIELDVMQVDVDQVVVTASQLVTTVESPVSMRRIGAEEIDMTPGANRDISKVVQSSPGVLSVSMGNRNDVLVRGGGANENRYYLDAIEIPVLNHFAVQGGSGGNASLVNTDLLRSVNFYTGAFPVQFANGLSSQLDMRMGNGNSEKFHGKAVVGASDVGLSLDTPISKNGKTTLLASYRRSYLKMLFSVLDLPFLPTYNDYQFKVSSKLSPNDELYFIGLGSFDKNRLNNNLRDLTPDRRYIIGYIPESDQDSYTFGVGYKHGFDGGQLRVVASRNFLDNSIYKDVGDGNAKYRMIDIHSHESDWRTRGEVELWDLGGFRFTGGIGGGLGHYYSNASFASSSEQDAVSQIIKMNIVRYELFATLSRYFFNDKLSLLFGLRADGMDYSASTRNPLKQLSPRASFSWQVAPKWSISGSAGRYYQEPSYTTLGFWKSKDYINTQLASGLRYMAVNQYVLGTEFTPDQRSSLRVEGFLKQYSRLPVSLNDSLPISTSDFEDYSVGNVPSRSVGKGHVYGAEVSYRNLDIYNTVVNVSYTLLFARINRLDESLSPIDATFASPWDSRHIINISAIHKFGHNWSAGFKWYLMGGTPYTPYDFDRSSNINEWNSRLRPYRDFSMYNSERNAAYHQLDVRVDKVWYFPHWRMGFYVDIQNLYNFKSRGQDIFAPQTDGDGKYIKDPTNPSKYKMQSIANDLGGTILPSIGITIEW